MSTAVGWSMCSEPVMRGAGQGLARCEFGPHGHQARHFVFGQDDFLAAYSASDSRPP